MGKKVIDLPKGVEMKIEGDNVIVKGPKGTLSRRLPDGISVSLDNSTVTLKRSGEENNFRALHGLYRSLLSNMVTGVFQGFERKLELSGVGYRVSKQGNKLVMQVGFSHPVNFDPPAGIEFRVEGQDKVIVAGADKELVGEVAARIRKTKKVEPYKLKGIKYSGEVIKKKAGKAAKAAGAGTK
ncbi:MAG: 50S ribosomal protein L6 [bacterium]